MNRKIIAATLVLLMSLLPILGGCSSFESGWAKLAVDVANTPALVECYSGGKLIFKGQTASKPVSEENSDGYFFKDVQSSKLVEVSGDCIFTYE